MQRGPIKEKEGLLSYKLLQRKTNGSDISEIKKIRTYSADYALSGILR